MLKLDQLTGATLEVMLSAWQAETPLSASELLASVNAARMARGVKPLSHAGASKATDQLLQLGFLSRAKTEPSPAVFHVLIPREQYFASAVQSLSQSVLGKNISDIFPALIGGKTRRRPQSQSPRSGETEAEALHKLAQAIASSEADALKD